MQPVEKHASLYVGYYILAFYLEAFLKYKINNSSPSTLCTLRNIKNLFFRLCAIGK